VPRTVAESGANRGRFHDEPGVLGAPDCDCREVFSMSLELKTLNSLIKQ
jgi:hypothetical protein